MNQFTKAQIAAMNDEEKLDAFKEMAQTYMDKNGCRWSEACLEVKRRHPDAAEAFGLRDSTKQIA